MSSIFSDLILGLGKLIKTPLKVDELNTCLLRIGRKLPVQLEINSRRNVLIIASAISEIPPGKFRENVLLYALKENQIPNVATGILGYSEKNNKLVLFLELSLDDLTPEKIHAHLFPFIERAKKWYSALEEGRPAPAELMRETREERNPFGMNP